MQSMGLERRLVGRTTVLVEGELRWTTKRAILGHRDHRVTVTTLDVSVDGAKLLAHEQAPLPAGASVRLSLDGHESVARVKSVTVNGSGRQVLGVQLESPSAEYLNYVERWLDADKGGVKFIGPDAEAA